MHDCGCSRAFQNAGTPELAAIQPTDRKCDDQCEKKMTIIDWKALAEQIGGLQPDGSDRTVGTQGGRRALEILIGEENLREAVDCFISLRPGAFTAEMVLKIIESEIAMNRCFEIYRTEPGTDRACSAVFLLGSMANDKALPWVREFLEDSNQAVRLNGLRVLQCILYGPLNDEEMAKARELLAKAEMDSDAFVRERAQSVRQHDLPR
jgi:hypothetical protein